MSASDDGSGVLRVSVRVHPGAKRTAVGGRYGEGDPPVLVVRVTAPPVEGKANAAVRGAVAEAFGLPRSAVTIEAGTTGRLKVLDLVGADSRRLDELLGG